MRRHDREISREAALDLLKQGEYGILSSIGPENQPYGVPVSFVLNEGCIDFHSATEGRKIDNIAHNDHVSFCVVGKTEILPDKFSTRYESVIVAGKVIELSGERKIRSLHALIAKYSPRHIEAGDKYIESAQATTRVFSIGMESVTGKARR